MFSTFRIHYTKRTLNPKSLMKGLSNKAFCLVDEWLKIHSLCLDSEQTFIDMETVTGRYFHQADAFRS